jgi:hypothetical protein
LFATLKLAGLDLEATQLESISAIQRLTILALSVAVRTLQMVEGRDNVELPATITFSADQQECLTQIEPTLEGRTSKQQNPDLGYSFRPFSINELLTQRDFLSVPL